MRRPPDPAAAEAAARLLAAGRPAREAADLLGVTPQHARRSALRGLRTAELNARITIGRVTALQAALTAEAGEAR